MSFRTTEEYNRPNVVPWKRCVLCQEKVPVFKSPRDFCRHLRECHCTKEGGSFVCRYGTNGICPSLPLEGVSDRDYEDHVAKDHVAGDKYPGAGGARRGSTQSNSSRGSRETTPVTNTEPNVVQDQHKWTIFNSKVNLPAVLNDPRLAKRETDFFTKTWGEAFDNVEVMPSPYLPIITKEHFSKYLKKTTGRFKKHVNNVRLSSSSSTDSSLPVDAFPALHSRRYEKSGPELEQIPKLFLLPNFTLENPDTFSAVFPWSHVEAVKPGMISEGRQSSKLLQEKLSHYLDIIEVQIAKQISFRADAFFHAMTSHDELQSRMGQTCAAIRHLRDKMHQLDSVLVQGSMDIMSHSKLRSNYVKVYNKLKLMSTVHQTQPTIQMLLSTNEFVGALDLISTTQEVLSQELAGIHSFRHLGSQLAEMEKLIDKMMQADFIRYVQTDLNRSIAETDLIMEQERLVAIVFGMVRQHKFQFVDIYREESCTALKAVIKQAVVTAVSEADVDMDEDVATLADQMRLMNYSKWMDLLGSVFKSILVILNRVKAGCDVMSEVVALAAGRAPTTPCVDEDNISIGSHDTSHVSLSMEPDAELMISQSDHSKLTSGLKEMLCLVCDHAHDRCVKVLAARAKDGFLERLGASEFMMLSRAVENFVSDCEKICGRKSSSLRGSLQSQSNRFVSRFHDERKVKLSLILDNERWKQADVPYEFQLLVNHIQSTGQLAIPNPATESGHQKPRDYIMVGEERFCVVGTSLIMLKMMVEYCQCIEDIPSITPDMLTRLIELLKVFNSRTCQLVLGAGAVQLVGLKTISTKNLALASQCLRLIIQYIPAVKEHFERHLPTRNQSMLKHFDQITKDFNDHILEIYNKLVHIIDVMIQELLKQWEVKAPMPSTSFRTVCKQVGKFHEAIKDLLPPSEIKKLFTRINTCFKTNLKNQVIKFNVMNDGGPQHGLVTADLAFYAGNLKSLKGLESLDLGIEDVWKR